MSKPFASRQRDDIDMMYRTSRWQTVRSMVISRDNGLCQECKRRGVITRGRVVHHIVEAREDINLFWELDNLEVICDSCHNREHPERSGGEKKAKAKRNAVKFYATQER